MISGTENEKVEMTDKMIERADELDNAVYDMLLTALQCGGRERISMEYRNYPGSSGLCMLRAGKGRKSGLQSLYQ